MNISLFGWLEKIPFWAALPYPIKGALLRALKAGLSAAVGVLLAAITAGTLFPVGFSPVVVLIVTSVLQALDKYLRETALVNEQKELLLLLTDEDGPNP